MNERMCAVPGGMCSHNPAQLRALDGQSQRHPGVALSEVLERLHIYLHTNGSSVQSAVHASVSVAVCDSVAT